MVGLGLLIATQCQQISEGNWDIQSSESVILPESLLIAFKIIVQGPKFNHQKQCENINVVYACNPSAWGIEMGGSLRLTSQID